jgi:LuxR family maltose regulon positive regulatory protein
MNCLGQLALLEILTGNRRHAAELATTVTRLAEQFSVPVQFLPAAAEVALAWVSAQDSDLVAAHSHADRATHSLSVCGDPLSAAFLTVVKARLRARRKEATTATEAGVSSDFDGPNVLLPPSLASRLTVAASRHRQRSVANRVDVPSQPNGDRARPVAMVRANATARYPQLEVASRDGERRAAEAKTSAAGTPGAAAVDHPPSEGLAASPTPLIQPLTDREMEVLEKLAAYFSTEEIAQSMFISVNTVRTHVRSILRKLSANRRNEALRRARQLQMIS